MLENILAILPTNGHGGCEYNALSTLIYIRKRYGVAIRVSFPRTETTEYLIELCRSNQIDFEPFDGHFLANDTIETCLQQQSATIKLLSDCSPSVVFVPMPWPKRGQGVIAGCADCGVPTVVKFALVPPTYNDGDFVLPAAVQAISKRQVWFANSRYSARLLEQHWGLRPNSVDSFHVGPIGLGHLVPAAAAAGAISRTEAREGVRAEFNLPSESRIAITVARLSTQKGYDALMDAAPHLLEEHSDLTMLWVGHGELHERIANWIYGNGLNNRIKLAGFRDDVRRLLRSSDIFILPTIYEGGCSQSLLEAMEEGLPIVVTNTSAVSEVAYHGSNAFLIPEGDISALIMESSRILNSPEVAQALGSNAKRDSAEFSASRSFEHTLLRLRSAMSTTGVLKWNDAPPPDSPFRQPISKCATLSIVATDPRLQLGWHQIECGPEGRAFRWMASEASLSMHVTIDRPAVLEVHCYSALTMEALETLEAFANGVRLIPIQRSAIGQTGNWVVSWAVEADEELRRTVDLRFSSSQAHRPRELNNMSGDARLLSVAISSIHLRSVQ